MLRIGRSLVSAIAIATLAVLVVVPALAGPHVAPPIDLPPIVLPRPTLVPLPGGPRSAEGTPVPTASPGADALNAGSSGMMMWTRNASLRRPTDVPKLSQFLNKLGNGRYMVRQVQPHYPASFDLSKLRTVRPQSATGATIYLTGDGTNYYENDQTLQYGSIVYLLCDHMKANTSYKYVMFPPNGSGPYSSNTETTNANGTCPDAGNQYGILNLSTPITAFGGTTISTDASYPGVWTFVMMNTATGNYETEYNVVANSALDFSTYSDLAMLHPAVQFTQSSYVVANATGLNPGHTYAFGWVYTGLANIPCVSAVPALGSYAGVDGTCFTGTSPTGNAPFAGAFTGSWTTTGASSVGNYDLELFDVTSKDYIGHQQFSLIGSGASAGVWALVPFNGATNGTDLNDIFATDGLVDQSTAGVKYTVTGLPAANNGHTVTLSVSNPNGAVLMGTGAYPHMAVPPTATQAGGSVTYTFNFPADSTYQQALGPSETPFAPNVFVAQLYDQTAATVVSSKAFQVLGYQTNFAWTSGVGVAQANTTPTTLGVTITNTGGSSYGSWNGDGVAGLKIATTPANGELLTLSSTSATDSAGNVWNFTLVGAGVNAVIVATPATANASMPVNGTLAFNINVTIPGGDCTATACLLGTQIFPLHGVNYSVADTATDPLEVVATGSGTSAPSYTWTINSETATGAKMADRLPDFHQLMYVTGTDAAPTTDTYALTMSINNTAPLGGHKIMDVRITFPASTDLSARPVTGLAVTGGVTGGGWTMYTNASGGTGIAAYGPNVIELSCVPASQDVCGVNVGGVGTVKFNIPVFTTAFPLQDIQATANFDGGGCGGGCTAASFNLISSSVSNQIAGSSNVDSTELGVASLNPSLMQTYFAPSSIGAVAGASTDFVFTNTSTTADPNPDDVDQIDLTFPSANVNPSSITVPTGWVATKDSGNALHWVIAGCTYVPGTKPINATPCLTNENAYALAAGQSVSIQLNYAAAPTVGSYAVTWSATGEAGADTKTTATTTTLTVSATAATVAFTNVAGVIYASGQPQVGADSTVNGNTYTYKLTNTGSSTITSSTITIPNKTTSGLTGEDTSNQLWDITVAPTVTIAGAGSSGTAGTCSGTLTGAHYTQPTVGTAGSIALTGCTIAVGGTATITFTAIAPYMVSSVFQWPATVTGAATVNASGTYIDANTVLIVLNGTLTIITPPNSGAVGGANLVTAAANSGATPATLCAGCSMTLGTPNTVNFGNFNGTFTTTDIIDASVSSDAADTNSWELYVETSANPTGGSGQELATMDDTSHSSSAAGYSILDSSYTTVSTVPNAGGTPLSSYSSVARHHPLDTIMDFQVTIGGIVYAIPQNVTLTYTLVFN
jgi:hypothetical protein